MKGKSTRKGSSYGKSLDSPPKGMEESLSGHAKGRASSSSAPPTNIDPDNMNSTGNISGCCSKPVKGIK